MKKTYEIEAPEYIHIRFERLLAMLHWNGRFGHSGLFAMPLDGDGADKITVDPEPSYRLEAELIGGVGYGVEIAYDHCFGGMFIDRGRDNKWYTGPAANLYKNGSRHNTIPSQDWDFKERTEIALAEMVGCASAELSAAQPGLDIRSEK